MLPKNDVINKAEISKHLNTEIIGSDIFCYKEIGSTNEQAKIFANKGFKEGTVIVSESQSYGRGRLGRKWVSEKDTGVFISVILKPDILFAEISQITLIVAIAVCKAISKTTILKPMIKWPNDIILNGKKVCGILTELNAETDKINYLITGIGINVNNSFFSDQIKNKATSLYLESNIMYTRKDIIVSVLKELEYVYKLFEKYKFKYFIDEYKNLCLNINSRVMAISSDNIIQGIAIDINADGSLSIKSDDGNIINVISGEVSLRSQNGYI